MTASSSVERAQAYLDAHLTRPHSAPAHVLTGSFITLSRETGTGGSALAEALCQRLNRGPGAVEKPWTAFDHDVVERALASNGLPAHLARRLPEARIPELQAAVGEILGLHPNVWSVVQQTMELMRRLAAAGHVVLIGHGANFATVALPRGFHLRLIGAEANRARRIAARLGLNEADALAYVRKTDAERASYVGTYCDRDIADPLAYDLTINTDRVSLGEIADLVTAQLPAEPS